MEVDTSKLEEMMTEKDVDSVDALLDKVKTEAEAGTLTSVEDQKESLKKQISDLETIKASQGDEIGTLRKDLEQAKESLTTLGKQKTDDASSADGKTEAEWAEENEKQLQSMTDADVAKLNETVQANEALKEIASTEEGKAGLIARIIGSTEEKAQEIFRRPQQEKKLTIGEQIDAALGKNKPNLTPSSRVAGSGYDPNRKTTREQPTREQINAMPHSERMNAAFGKQK